jgi:dCMP deaminase
MENNSSAPKELDNSKWDRRFLELAKHVSTWSKDPSTRVGAIIVGPNSIVVGLGYNGFPRGVLDLNDRLNDREQKYAMVVHAEANAILMAGDKARGAVLYVWPSFVLPPICNECCKLVIQSGIKEVVGYIPTPEAAERAKRWKKSIEVSQTMCKEAGVSWRSV